MKNKSNKKILVTKSFLPPLSEYTEYLKGVWDRRWVTNHGKLALELESTLKKRFGVKHVFFMANGTIALQIAIKAADIEGEIITTPFSFAATTTAILWEKCKPVFVDINPSTFAIDEAKIEAAITDRTRAILAVHVYGYPCNVQEIERIAKKHKLKVIYDAAHAFDVKIGEKSIFEFGDISALSLHATKLFHSGEGGLLITNNDKLAKKIKLLRDFGLEGEGSVEVGINGKNSELHAAMGLTNLKHVDLVNKLRGKIINEYKKLLEGTMLHNVTYFKDITYNNAYFPVIFDTEKDLLNVKQALENENIFARRYFYPSLNKLPFVEYRSCPISESIAQRVLCLPLYHDLSLEDVKRIVKIIKNALKKKVPSLAIGIPAYNESGNIINLLESIIKQNADTFYIKEIIVNSDGSNDDTVKIVKNYSLLHGQVRAIINKKRKGKSFRLNEIYAAHDSDYLLTLDADVVFANTDAIEKMIMVFDSPDVLVSAGNFIPLPSRSFLGRIMYSNNVLWNYTRENLNHGDHISNLYGGASMLRKDFSKEVLYPENITCDEEYLYLKAKGKRGFRFAQDAYVFFKAPSSLKDVINQGHRFHTERKMLIDIFGKEVLSMHDIPLDKKIKALFKTLKSGQFLVFAAILLNVLVRLLPYEDKLNKKGMWQMATSTKVI